MYAFTFKRNDKAALIFRFDDPDMAIKILQKGEINIIGSIDLFNAQ